MGSLLFVVVHTSTLPALKTWRFSRSTTPQPVAKIILQKLVRDNLKNAKQKQTFVNRHLPNN